MHRVFIVALLFSFFATTVVASVSAQTASLSPTVLPIVPADITTEVFTATQEATTEASTISAEVASASARIDEKIQEKSATDITQTSGTVKGRLAQLLDETPVGPLSVVNFIQYLIRQAVDRGVPANMLVLMLMFPVIVSFIAASRHVIGLEGFGVYGPAVLAVAFVSTGIVTGIVLFLAITFVALVGRSLFRRLKLQYLPRTALLLWFVSLMIFFALVFSPYFSGLINIASVGIFPILVLILLSENFIGSQVSLTSSRLFELTFETILLSAGSALLMGLSFVQDLVILHPEITILFVALLDVAVGKYTGLRVTEYFRFKPILDEEE